MGVPSPYTVSTHIYKISSSGKLVNRLLTSKEAMNVLFELINFIWLAKERDKKN